MSEQCTTCDNVAELIEVADCRSLEDASATLGSNPPALHRHLIGHERVDLMGRLTYGGEAMVEQEQDASPSRVPSPGLDSDPVVINGPVVIDGPAIEVATLSPELDARVDMEGALIWLKPYADHEDQGCAEAAAEAMAWVGILDERLSAWSKHSSLREELAALEARRAEILAALGVTESTEPEPEQEPEPEAPAPAAALDRDWPAIREWAAQMGLECPSRGRVPRAVVEAYDARWSA